MWKYRNGFFGSGESGVRKDKTKTTSSFCVQPTNRRRKVEVLFKFLVSWDIR